MLREQRYRRTKTKLSSKVRFHAIQSQERKFKFSSSRVSVQARLRELPPGDYTVEVKKHYKQRSLNQNRYYWAVIVTLVYEGLRDAGFDDIHTNEDAHKLMKNMFFKKVIFSPRSGELEIEMSTTEYSTGEFELKMDEIRLWAFTFLGVTIPLPNTQAALDLQ